MSSLSTDLRPSQLSEVIGHESVKAAITKQLASGRIPTAWLFSGPPGVGKTTLALILANSLPGNEGLESLDIRMFNAGDRNGVDDAREWADQAGNFPMVGRYKVFILDEAHQLTQAAQNTLLIPTEVKNSPTIFLFCTTDSSKLLPALKSRCLHFDLKPLGKQEVLESVDRTIVGMNPQPLNDGIGAVAEFLWKARITSPRAVLNALEMHFSGVPLEKCVTSIEHEPLYRDVAAAVIKGDWSTTRSLLEGIKTVDISGMRSMISAYFRTALLKSDFGPRADALSACLLNMSSLNAFETGIAQANLVAALYRCCSVLSKGK